MLSGRLFLRISLILLIFLIVLKLGIFSIISNDIEDVRKNEKTFYLSLILSSEKAVLYAI